MTAIVLVGVVGGCASGASDGSGLQRIDRAVGRPAAIGAGGDDEGGQIQPGFADVVYAAEQVRLDPTSTDRDLNDAIKALSDAQDDYAR